MIYDCDALLYISRQFSNHDDAASSHWQYYHQFLEINDDMNIASVKGFGDGKKSGLLADLAHEIFQTPYRRMVKRDDEFKALNAIAKQSAKDRGIRFSLDVLRQVLTLADLKAKKLIKPNQDAIVIGDGFGSLTSLLLQSGIARKVVLVNLTKTLFVDIAMLMRIPFFQRERAISLVFTDDEMKNAMADDSVKVIALEATNSHILHSSSADIAFNIASMQEMDMKSVNEYFVQLRKISAHKDFLFYCCNRKEKQLPDGSWIRFDEYPWKSGDTHYFDELCPWHQYYYKYLPPSYCRYDGPIQHRLTKFGTTQ